MWPWSRDPVGVTGAVAPAGTQQETIFCGKTARSVAFVEGMLGEDASSSRIPALCWQRRRKWDNVNAVVITIEQNRDGAH
ncbi:unnamed protein product, partial [Allacma fusca]